MKSSRLTAFKDAAPSRMPDAPSYFTASASTGYVLEAGPWVLSSYARIDNLFNRRHARSVIVNEGNARYYEPASGRNWSAGLNASYVF